MNKRNAIIRIAALMLIFVLVIGMAVPAFAVDGGGKIRDMVNLRTGPSLNTSVIDTLGVGTVVTIVSTVTEGTVVNNAVVEGTWYQVNTPKGTGYVRSDYVTLDSAATPVPTAPSGNPTPTPSISTNASDFNGEFITINGQRYMKAYITASDVSLRQSASTSSSKLATLPKNAAVALVALADDFYKVIYNGKTGYVSKQFVRLTGTLVVSATPTPTVSLAGAVSGPSEWTPVSDAPAAKLTASESAYWATVPSLYSEYKKLNGNTVGFLAVPNSNIRYPVLFSNSDFYLDHNIYNKADIAGMPYIHKDYDNYGKIRHIVVAGHNMKAGTMFKTLNNYKSLSFYQSNPIIRFDYMGVPGEWQIFSDEILNLRSSATIKRNEWVAENSIKMNFSSDNEWLTYINLLKTRSNHYGKVSDVTLRTNDVVLTLYTCTYESWLDIVHGRHYGRYLVHFRRVR